MLFRKIIAVYSVNHRALMNTLYWKNYELLNVKHIVPYIQNVPKRCIHKVNIPYNWIHLFGIPCIVNFAFHRIKSTQMEHYADSTLIWRNIWCECYVKIYTDNRKSKLHITKTLHRTILLHTLLRLLRIPGNDTTVDNSKSERSATSFTENRYRDVSISCISRPKSSYATVQ
jgi:hypothetical protein